MMTNGDLYLILARYRGATLRVIERADGSLALMCGTVIVMSADPPPLSGHEATSGHVVRNLTTEQIGVVICGTNDGRLSIALRAGGPSVYTWDRPNVEIIGLV